MGVCGGGGGRRALWECVGGGVGHCGSVWGGGEGWHKASVSDCLPLAVPIGLSPLLILTLCGPEHVLVVSTEPPDDLSCLTTPGVGCPGDGAVARAADHCAGGDRCGGRRALWECVGGGGGTGHHRGTF